MVKQKNYINRKTIDIKGVDGNKMFVKCNECLGVFDISSYNATEIVKCPDCGTEYEVILTHGTKDIRVLVIEGEDWGE